MQSWAYWKVVFRRCLRDTRLLAISKMIIGIATALTNLFAQRIFWGLQWHEIERIFISVILSYLFVLVVAFLLNLLRIPAIIHDEQNSQIALANAEIQRLNSQSKVDQIEEKRRKLMSEKMQKYFEPEKEVLRFFLLHGKSLRPDSPHADPTVRKAIADHILVDDNMAGHHYYYIKDELKNALNFVLNSQ